MDKLFGKHSPFKRSVFFKIFVSLMSLTLIPIFFLGLTSYFVFYRAMEILLLGFIILLIPGCYNFNNAVDPDSDNYQGYPSAPPPDEPSDLTAEYMGSYIYLEWTDNSDNETGFKIERKFEPSGDFTEIGTVGSDVTTYDDVPGDLTPGTIYTYRVRAYNSNGDSAYSNEASATITP